MPAITYQDFSGGLDRRLSINVQEASRLWTLRNAYITLGKRIRKRPALRKVNTGLSGSFGLENINGTLSVFVTKGGSFSAPAGVSLVELDQPASITGDLMAVEYADIFTGYPYVVAAYDSGTTTAAGKVVPVYAHHYVDANPSTEITDTNCPNGVSVTKAASRVFGIDGEVVRYCAAGDPRDWTSANDAGFLPASLQQDTKSGTTAVGTFQDALVVFFSEGAQIWDVAVDPTANAIRKRIYGVGVKEDAAMTLASFASDLAFLSPFGVRSMTIASQTDRIDDTDIGVPIDTLVLPDVETATGIVREATKFGTWVHQFGQYWLVLDQGGLSKVWAYTYSKSSKIACWSEYEFPLRIEAIATVDGTVYIRSEDDLYVCDAEQFTDDGMLVNVEVQMAFQDAKTPGVLKQFHGADYVVQGSPYVAFKYDPRDTTKESTPQLIPGDTRSIEYMPVEICAAAIAPVFRHSGDEAFELSAASLFFESLGLQR